MMKTTNKSRLVPSRSGSLIRRASAFSLVELLTVIFIISLLIGILIPSLTAARNAAKSTSTAAMLNAIKISLESWKNDHERFFRSTNGYPPSFAHPRIGLADFNSTGGEFPFTVDYPRVYGAHWLATMLLGKDTLGYIDRSDVPRVLKNQPETWYDPDPLGDGSGPLKRSLLYLDPTKVRLVATNELPGQRNEMAANMFPGWPDMENLPVIVDAFEQPILYYAASAHGQTSNMVESIRQADNYYSGGGFQENGQPFYFHQDNEGFTGNDSILQGWDFGGRVKDPNGQLKPGFHGITLSGHDMTPNQLNQLDYPRDPSNFAFFVRDASTSKFVGQPNGPASGAAPMRPVNPDSYLLITAGIDSAFGTTDDVCNFNPFGKR